MGRWGDDLYDSDAALDYNATITMRIEREIAFGFLQNVFKMRSGGLLKF